MLWCAFFIHNVVFVLFIEKKSVPLKQKFKFNILKLIDYAYHRFNYGSWSWSSSTGQSGNPGRSTVPEQSARTANDSKLDPRGGTTGW